MPGAYRRPGSQIPATVDKSAAGQGKGQKGEPRTWGSGAQVLSCRTKNRSGGNIVYRILDETFLPPAGTHRLGLIVARLSTATPIRHGALGIVQSRRRGDADYSQETDLDPRQFP